MVDGERALSNGAVSLVKKNAVVFGLTRRYATIKPLRAMNRTVVTFREERRMAKSRGATWDGEYEDEWSLSYGAFQSGGGNTTKEMPEW